ncbi:hypothetical protein TNCT_252491 [Trichonephila clavata]|uniref:Uncharacterized protein n=1 Tax=Trichonephila clavata TaxID=2740835 RepID=A0A8X6EZB0_TRICU|nr:hypothetical protein TNCT_252491 [Trichonephila clavata]
MQPSSGVPDGKTGVEQRFGTLELPDDLTSDVELQQPGHRRSSYGTLKTPKMTFALRLPTEWYYLIGKTKE